MRIVRVCYVQSFAWARFVASPGAMRNTFVQINWLSVFAIHRWSLENRLLGYHCINNIPPYSFPLLSSGRVNPFFSIS
jgi:hypothetical protein